MEIEKKIRQTFTGTPCWMAPEVMEQTNGYDYKADIWSFGITAMELAYGTAPYAKFQPMKVLLLTLQEEPPTCDIYKDTTHKFSKHFYSLISKCLRKDPLKRPNATKLLSHKFFKKAKDASYIAQQIFKKLPAVPPPNPLAIKQPLDLKTLGGLVHSKNEKAKPVSVGSWVFDKEELENMKRKSYEEKKLKEKQSQQQNPQSQSNQAVTDPSQHHNNQTNHIKQTNTNSSAPNAISSQTSSPLSSTPSTPRSVVSVPTSPKTVQQPQQQPQQQQQQQQQTSQVTTGRFIVETDSQPSTTSTPSSSSSSTTTTSNQSSQAASSQQGRFSVLDQDS